MTFDEWETRYNESRPEEPRSSDENPEQWSSIALYAEEKLKEAYYAGAEHKAEEIAENLNGTTSFENYKQLCELKKTEQWHYPSKGELPEIVCGSDFVIIVTKTVYDNIEYHIGFYSKELGFYKVNEKSFKNEPIHGVIAWKRLRYNGGEMDAGF